LSRIVLRAARSALDSFVSGLIRYPNKMATDTTCFHVAIIGPSDTADEVQAIQTAIGVLSTRLSRKGISIVAHHWSQLPPGIGEPQGYIDDCLAWADIDFVVGVMRRKFGAPVRDAKSGTEHEVRVVLELHAQHGAPDLLFYFHSDAAESSVELSEFASFLRAKALTGTFDDPQALAREVGDHLRDKVESKATKVSGVPAAMGRLPANRRVTVEWILGAQMQAKEKSIPSVICFKNGNGEEFIFDCRLPNFQEFANWIMSSMGLAPKENDCLLRYLRETSIESSKPGAESAIAQFWLGNIFMITHNKLGECEFKICIAKPAMGKEHAEKLRKQIEKGILPFPPKQIFIGEDGKKIYIT